MKQIIFLNPVFKQMIWGGNRLATDFGYDIPGDNTGECWGISAHTSGDDSIANDCYAGMTLSQLWDEHPELFGNIEGDRFPLLIKIIDAKDNLSIQVHPYDEYAAKNENGSLGKTECWYIIDCPDDAKLVVGHNAKTHEELSDMIHEGRWDEFIRYVPIKKGDFIQIEIEDNGKGIGPKDLPYIFDRFYRTDVSRNSSKGGSGIGLSIVKKILEDHGGKVWATSRLGIGTIMYFVLRKYQEVPMK